ncbi:MAG: DUF4158 domain-containing protein [Steroidobacteraceae bacterium]|jgi:uncharacterized protein DUF4158
MAVSFLTAAQRARYGRYPEVVTADDLARCFHLSDDDRVQIMSCRGHHNRLSFALQLSTVRYLGTFLEDPIAVPSSVLQSPSHQLAIHTLDGLERYRKGEQREEHVTGTTTRLALSSIISVDKSDRRHPRRALTREPGLRQTSKPFRGSGVSDARSTDLSGSACRANFGRAVIHVQTAC